MFARVRGFGSFTIFACIYYFARTFVINDNGRRITTLVATRIVDWNIHVGIIFVDSVFSNRGEYIGLISCILRYFEVNWTDDRV